MEHPFEDQELLLDARKRPVPQLCNPETRKLEPLPGSAASGLRMQIYDGAGNPIEIATNAALDTLNNKVATDVGLAALDATLQAIGVVVGDRATEATLESAKQALASLDGKVATATKQDAAKGVLDAISTAVAARATEATLAQIKTALTDGTLKAQLTGRKVQVRDVTATSTATVAAGATQNIDIAPTAGYIGRLRGLTISQAAPTSATKNTHYINIIVGGVALGQLSAAYNAKLALDYSTPNTGTNSKPADGAALATVLSNIAFSSANPLRLSYTNGTDADQTSARYIYALIEEEAIV